ncbi:nucleoside/nucleotide kinase family protein, partial [Salmonella enterica subsp. enterica serovar Montevideo]|nr:nucleoside/nucleotide kinase family protein [Salmonella enterica subsp. enterica serovar Montevideo]
VVVTAPIVIVEGNWLLRDDDRWRALAEFCDFSLFIRAPAETFYERTDGPNVRRVLESSLPADLMLEMTSTGEYRMACP